MAYRRYKKRFYKRYGRKSFSRYSTYKNRSAKAQASQIYRLNRRINHIEKNTKPEILTYDNNDYTNIFDYSDLAPKTWKNLDKFFVTDSNFNNNKVVNKSCRIRKVIIYGTMSRDVDTDILDSSLSRDPSSFIRMLVLQHKDTSKIPASNDAVNALYFTGSDGLLDYNAPLKTGASTHDRILKYKKFKITSYTPNMITFKFTVRPYYNIFTKCEDLSTQDAKGSIYCVIQGYHFGRQTTDIDSTTVLTLRSRIIYHDN